MSGRLGSGWGLLAAVMVLQSTLFGGARLGLAAQPKPSRALHYELVMSGDDSVCKPLASLYNKLLAGAIAAFKAHPATAPFMSDFEVWEPDSFASIGFELPPLEMGRPDAAIYRADVFNDGVARPVFVGDVDVGPIPGNSLVVLRADADRKSLSDLVDSWSGYGQTHGFRPHSSIVENIQISSTSRCHNRTEGLVCRKVTCWQNGPILRLC